MLRLASLTNEDFFVLLQKLRHVHASGIESKYLIPDEALIAFMQHASKRLGEAYFRTPRTTITAFLNLLATLEQHPEGNWQEMLGAVTVEKDMGGAVDGVSEDDELKSFRL